MVASFDSAPTADSEIYSKLDKTVRDSHESQVSFLSRLCSIDTAEWYQKTKGYLLCHHSLFFVGQQKYINSPLKKGVVLKHTCSMWNDKETGGRNKKLSTF